MVQTIATYSRERGTGSESERERERVY